MCRLPRHHRRRGPASPRPDLRPGLRDRSTRDRIGAGGGRARRMRRRRQVIAVGAVIMVAGLALLRAGAAPGCGRGLAGARPARQRPRDGYGPRPAGGHRAGPGHAATRPPGRRGAVYRAVGRQRPGRGAARDRVLRALGGGMPHAFRRRAQFPGPAVYALPTARTIRPPDRAAAAGNDPGRLTMKPSASAGRVAFAVLDRRRGRC